MSPLWVGRLHMRPGIYFRRFNMLNIVYYAIGGVATVEIDENLSDIEVISPTGTRVSEANLEDSGLLTFPASRVGRYIVRSSRGPVAEVEALDATAVKVLSIGDAVAHRPAILTGKQKTNCYRIFTM